MAFVLNDRVKETTTTTGTGTVNLAGAETGFESFVAGIGNSNTTYYAIVHQSLDEFEVGLGTITDATPDTLARTTVISSSNSDSAVNFSAGTKDVFCTLPASKAIVEDGSGNLEIDISGIINLDADNGGNINLKDGGTLYGTFQKENDDLRIISNVSDGDIIFRGNDGGTYLNALTLDMSNSGDAVFRRQITCREAIYINTADNSATTGYLYDDSGDFVLRSFTQDKDIVFKGNDGGSIITPLRIDMSTGGRAIFNSDLIALDTVGQYLQMAGTGGTYWAIGSTGGSNPPSTPSTTLAFHHYDGSNWNNEVEFDSGGNIVADGNITAYSDERLKDNIKTLEDGLAKVNQLRGVSYNKDNKKSIGVIAQEVEKVLPEIVITGKTEDKFKSVDYGRLTAVLIEAVKEQQKQIQTLTTKVEELEAK